MVQTTDPRELNHDATLSRPGPPVKNQFGNLSFGDLDSQFKQFTLNPGSIPKRVGLRHLQNKISDFRVDRGSSGSFAPGLSFPEQLELFLRATS